MNQMKPFRLFSLLASLLIAAAVWAAAPENKSQFQNDPHGWVNIQPSADLKGWTRVAIPPTNALGGQQWHVEGSALVCNGDTGHEMLRFDKELGDCILHVEFAFTPVANVKNKYNSGVFVRNSADGTIWHQAQLTMNGGYLFGDSPADGKLKRFQLHPTEQRMKPAGEWNTLEVTAQGKTLTVWLNGAVTSTWDECQVPKGYLALESEGYRIEFRNLKLKEL